MRLVRFGAAALSTGLVVANAAIAMPPPPKNFVGAPMSGANEAPPVETCAEGVTLVKLKDGVLTFKVNVEGLEDIVAAHLHYGFPGENGPVLVTLFEMSPPDPQALRDDDYDDEYDDDDDDVDEADGYTLASGVIRDDDVDNPGDITFEDGTVFEGGADGLLRLLREGAIYVNVHTVANPGGEIRAQLRGAGTGGPNPNKGAGDLCDKHDDCPDECDCDCDCQDDGWDDDRLSRADFNGDGVVNDADLRLFLDAMMRSQADDEDDDEQDDRPQRRRRGMMPYGR